MQRKYKPEEEGEENNLRRWVANLQLESWQLELLITGFSIFLLATSVEGYREWSDSLNFNKLVPTSAGDAIFMVAARFIVTTIPYALQFFLISLLVHLLLRGFWIGIVGLSSVSNRIGFYDMGLKGPFRKYLPNKVRTLDELILYLDNISSVIFAYTFLLAFSIISVVLVSSFLFVLIGIGTGASYYIDNNGVAFAVSLISFLSGFLLAIAAIVFFLDTLLFSAFKKSKWFSVLYYPIYRFYSVISLSFLYRSIYYHLITNYKRKQIITVTGLLAIVVFASFRIEGWNAHSYYPEESNSNGLFFQNSQYDDLRKRGYIGTASIPSRIVEGNYLELFIRYSPKDNIALDLLCPEYERLENDPSFFEGVSAGVESTLDTVSINDLLYDSNYENKVNNILECFKELIQVKLDDEIYTLDNLFFTRHENKNEKGVMTMLDISNLSRGLHMIEIKKKEINANPFAREFIVDDLTLEDFVKIPFWKD